jgi:hypothetical protein
LAPPMRTASISCCSLNIVVLRDVAEDIVSVISDFLTADFCCKGCVLQRFVEVTGGACLEYLFPQILGWNFDDGRRRHIRGIDLRGASSNRREGIT